MARGDPIGTPSSAAPERRRTLASLSSRNYRLFFFGQTVSQVGNWLTMVALTLLILRRTDSGLAVGCIICLPVWTRPVAVSLGGGGR